MKKQNTELEIGHNINEKKIIFIKLDRKYLRYFLSTIFQLWCSHIFLYNYLHLTNSTKLSVSSYYMKKSGNIIVSLGKMCSSTW